LLNRLESEPLEDVISSVEEEAKELWHKQTKTITDKARLVAAESFLRAIGLELEYEETQ